MSTLSLCHVKYFTLVIFHEKFISNIETYEIDLVLAFQWFSSVDNFKIDFVRRIKINRFNTKQSFVTSALGAKIITIARVIEVSLPSSYYSN
jgi:hypothetical protein